MQGHIFRSKSVHQVAWEPPPPSDSNPALKLQFIRGDNSDDDDDDEALFQAAAAEVRQRFEEKRKRQGQRLPAPVQSQAQTVSQPKQISTLDDLFAAAPAPAVNNDNVEASSHTATATPPAPAPAPAPFDYFQATHAAADSPLLKDNTTSNLAALGRVGMQPQLRPQQLFQPGNFQQRNQVPMMQQTSTSRIDAAFGRRR